MCLKTETTAEDAITNTLEEFNNKYKSQLRLKVEPYLYEVVVANNEDLIMDQERLFESGRREFYLRVRSDDAGAILQGKITP